MAIRELKLPKMYRDVEVEFKALERVDGDTSPKLYEVAVSSEFPVSRWFGKEILSHEKAAVDMSRLRSGAAFLLNHSTGTQIGVVDSARLDDDKVLRASVRFSKSALGQEIEQDVNDGIRRHISVGYQPIRAKLIEKGDDEKDGPDTWRITRWQPMEVSLVAVPADPTVGVGREVAGGESYSVEIEEDEPTPITEGVRNMSDPIVIDTGAADLAALQKKRFAEIAKFAHDNGMSGRLEGWIESGKDLGQCALEVLSETRTQGAAAPKPFEHPKGAPEYSYARAIRGAVLIKEGSGKLFDGYEREVHDELSRAAKTTGYVEHGGVMIPLVRSLDTKTSGKGTEWVVDEQGADIELLRNRSCVVNLGAQVLTGLGAPMWFNKQKSGMTFYWMGENPAAAVAESDIGLGVVQLAPKTLMGAGSFSRQLLILGNRSAETMIRNEISIGHGLALDLAAIHGIGAAGVPMGVYIAPDVNSVAMGGAPTWDKLVDMQTEIAKDNADLGNMGWLTTPGEAGKMRKTLVAASAGSEFLWSGTFRDGIVAGYKAMASNQVSATMTGTAGATTGGSDQGIIFANWSDMVIGMFSGMEIIVDNVTLAGKAMIKMTSFSMADVMVRRGESFCKGTGLTA